MWRQFQLLILSAYLNLTMSQSRCQRDNILFWRPEFSSCFEKAREKCDFWLKWWFSFCADIPIESTLHFLLTVSYDFAQEYYSIEFVVYNAFSHCRVEFELGRWAGIILQVKDVTCMHSVLCPEWEISLTFLRSCTVEHTRIYWENVPGT